MPDAHEPVLIATIAIGLALAFVFGLVARRLRMPPIVGYLLAGVAVGPFTPGFVADQELALELAEIGVILLMFGVGIHFSLRDILAVRGVAVPGAVVQITVATVLGTLLGLVLGWRLSEAVVLGLSISVASTVVLIRALTERGELLSAQGRIAVGWLIVEDLFTVVVLVMLPSLATITSAVGPDAADRSPSLVGRGLRPARAGLLAVLVIVVGVRVVPRLLAYVARLQDRELFTLAAVAIALGIAYLSFAVFGVSLALGAFLAGAIVSESDTSHQVAADALPLREVFSVLFFVSVGMLLDPASSWPTSRPSPRSSSSSSWPTPIAAFAIVAILGEPPRVGLTVAAGLAQIGEFTFILATTALGLACARGGRPARRQRGDRLDHAQPAPLRGDRSGRPRHRRRPRLAALVAPRPGALSTLPDTTAPGPRRTPSSSGPVASGDSSSGALARRGFPFVVVSEDRHDVERLRDQGRLAVFGDAAHARCSRPRTSTLRGCSSWPSRTSIRRASSSTMRATPTRGSRSSCAPTAASTWRTSPRWRAASRPSTASSS